MEIQAQQSEGNKPTLPVILLPLKEREDESDKSLFKNQSLSSQQIQKGQPNRQLPQVNQIRRFLHRGDRLQPSLNAWKDQKQMYENKVPERSSTSLYKSLRHFDYPLNEDQKQAEIKRLYLSHKKNPSKINFRTALYKFNKTSQEVQTDDIMIPEMQQQSQVAPDPAFYQLHKPSYLTIDVVEEGVGEGRTKNSKYPIYVEADEEENSLLPRKGKKGVGNRVKALSTINNQNKSNNMNSYLKNMAKIDHSFHSNLNQYSQRYKEYREQQTIYSKTIDVKPLRPLNETLSNLGQVNSDFKSQPTTAVLQKNESRTTQQLPGGLPFKSTTSVQNNFSSFGTKVESRIENILEPSLQVVERAKAASTIQEVTNQKDSSLLPQYSRDVQQNYQNSRSREHDKNISRIMNRNSAFQTQRQSKSDREPVLHLNKESFSKVAGDKKSELIQVPSVHEIKVGQGESAEQKMASTLHPIRQNFGKPEMNWIQSYYLHKSDFLSQLSSTNFQIKKYQNGVYFGQLSPQGKKHGKGVVFYFSGKVYEGDLVNDLKHGFGQQNYPDGSSYKGDFKEGVRHGRGVFQWGNGELYDGEWDRGRKTGSGMWKSSEGESYIGQWKKDKVQGFGVFVMTNGSRYQGQFKNSLKHGTGTERFNNGETYVGSYERNRPNGEGQYYWANGDYYKGFFSNGLRHRQGFFREAKTGIQYQGEYHNDKKCGYGEIHYGDDLVYRGNFQNNFRHGYGELVQNGKLIYRGYWINDHQVDDENHQPLTNDPVSSKIEEQPKEKAPKKEPLPKPVKPVVRAIVRPKKITEKVSEKRQKNIKKESLSPQGEEGYQRACGCNRKH